MSISVHLLRLSEQAERGTMTRHPWGTPLCLLLLHPRYPNTLWFPILIMVFLSPFHFFFEYSSGNYLLLPKSPLLRNEKITLKFLVTVKFSFFLHLILNVNFVTYTAAKYTLLEYIVSICYSQMYGITKNAYIIYLSVA